MLLIIFFNKNNLFYFFKKMRVENHINIRHIMLYHYVKGWNAAQSFRDLNELFGDHTTLPSYNGRLSVILSKLKSSFF